jgi:hypothetical protein
MKRVYFLSITKAYQKHDITQNFHGDQVDWSDRRWFLYFTRVLQVHQGILCHDPELEWYLERSCTRTCVESLCCDKSIAEYKVKSGEWTFYVGWLTSSRAHCHCHTFSGRSDTLPELHLSYIPAKKDPGNHYRLRIIFVALQSIHDTFS